MRTLIRCAVVACATLFTCKPTSAQSANDRLGRDLDSLLSDTSFTNATFGVAIQSLQTGEYLYRKNDMKSLLPASNMKLFTTAEALALLGPEYRYKTELLTNGQIKNHRLLGEVIVRGSGDPTFCDSDWSTPGQWIDSLNRRGIEHVDGAVIGDDSYWTKDIYPSGWEVEDIPYYYAMQTSALNFNENQISVRVSPGDAVGAPASIDQGDFDFGYDTIENYAITGQDSSIPTIDVGRVVGNNTIWVTGSIPHSSDMITEQASLENPTRYAAEAVSAIWREANFQSRTASQAVQSGMEPTSYKQALHLAQYISPPLSDIIRHMNKTSDNLYAECLFRTVAKVIGGEGSWTRGIEVMRKYLTSIGIDTARIQFTDGSGLSRMDLVTADDIVKLLRVMHGNPKLWRPFYNSLPIVGIDGTLDNRLKGTAAQGNIRAKTGSMTGARAISGYLTTRDGEPIAFSILANNYTNPGSKIGKLEDELLLKLVNFSRR